MRKIWTRLATLVLVLVVTISFSACSLFTTNLDKKYSADVMVITMADSDLSISRQELYYGYLEWGYQYANYYSSTEDLLEYIANALLNSKILERKSIEKFGELRDAEKALALKQAYQSLDKTIRSYVYEALNLDDNQDNATAEKDDTEVDESYTPSIFVSYENGERVFTMNLSSYADEDGTGTLSLNDYQYYVPTVPGVAGQNDVKKAISKIVRNLQSLENGFTKLKTPARDYLMPDSDYFKDLSQKERAVLNREIERMVKSNQTSILGDRFNVIYELGLTDLSGNDAVAAWNDYLNRSRNFDTWCELINGYNTTQITNLPAYFGKGRDFATNLAQNVMNYYQNQVFLEIDNQANNYQDSDLESTLVSSGLADAYYVPQEIANNLFTVSHILIGYTDEQKEEVKNIETEAARNPSFNAQDRLNSIYAETKSDGVSAADILLELKNKLSKAENLKQKYQIFREYINRYNSDPGMQNLDQLDSNSKPQYEYVMSSTADKNKMVEAFTAASIELFNAGIKGEISGLVWTEYGAHIIMYTRDLSDLIFTGVKGAFQYDALFTTLTAYGNRTLFDTLYDAYFKPDYTNYRSSRINDYKHEHQVTIVDSELKDFFK